MSCEIVGERWDKQTHRKKIKGGRGEGSESTEGAMVEGMKQEINSACTREAEQALDFHSALGFPPVLQT